MQILLSSAEGPKNVDTLEKVGKKMNLLVTFYYLRKKSDKKVVETLNRLKKISKHIMLDSGAFTFINEYQTQRGLGSIVQKRKTKINIDGDKYYQEYLEFVSRYKDYFDYIVELDIDMVIGYKKVLGWRKKFMDLVGEEKSVLVFHSTIPNCYVEWENWCKKYPKCLLGIGTDKGGANMSKLFSISYKYKMRVHGFAKTQDDLLKAYPWFSVDSSSWNAGQRFGQIFYFCGKELRLKAFRNSLLKNDYGVRKFIQEVFPKISKYIPMPIKELLLKRQNSWYLDILNVLAFIEYEKQLTSLWEKRGVKFNS